MFAENHENNLFAWRQTLGDHGAPDGSAVDPRSLTDEERLQRIVDREEIEQIASKRVYYKANEERARELEELWVQEADNRKTASFGKNWGFYTGMDSIRAYYVVSHEAHLKQSLAEYCKVVPGLTNDTKNLGYGYTSVSPYIAPAIQVAGDGKTAKGMWYSIGMVTEGKPDGSVDANWLCTKIAMDFIREAAGWKIWHVVEVNDSFFPAGTNYGDTPDIYMPGEDPMEVEFGTPDIQVQTHDRILCWADDYPWMPEPYYTMTPDHSYGPEGWPHLKMEVFRV